VYVLAPLPVGVTTVLLHVVVGVAPAVTVGAAFMFTTAVAVLVHKFASVPVTVYVALDVTANGVASVIPPDHVYDDAPPPVTVAFAF
jgi:hypothetical protein